MFSLALALFLFFVLSFCAVQDLRERKLYPFWIVTVLAVGLVQGPPLFNVVLAAVFFGWCMLMWKAKFLGGGDAKLLPVVVLAAPFSVIFIVVLSVLMAAAGAVITILPTRNKTDLLGKFPLAILIWLAWLSQVFLLMSG